MRILVISWQHGLLPLAWRLVREGHEVEVRVVKARFDRCWAGKLPRYDGPWDGDLGPALAGEDVTVLTDSTHWCRELTKAGAARTFGVLERPGPPEDSLRMALGGWWTGEVLLQPHLWLEELGAWTGGQGPAVPGAGMVVHLNHWPDVFTGLVDGCQDELKSEGFQGLVQVWVTFHPEQGWSRVGLTAGWPALHTEAFVSELEDFGGLLGGVVSPVRHRYVVVLPVSVPPWPTQCNVPAGVQGLGGLEPKDLAQVFFHDVTIEGTDVRTAGTDGLVGVVRGASNYPHLARQLAAALAAKARLREKQFRADGGALAEQFLLALERATGTS